MIALLVAAAYMESAATLDVTVHEPTAFPVRVELAIEQFEPPEATAYVTWPVPTTPEVERPVVENTSGVVVPAETVIVCGVSATVKVTAVEVAAYVVVSVADAVIWQLPAPVKVRAAVEEFTVQPVVPALVTA